MAKPMIKHVETIRQEKNLNNLPDIAIAAIASYKKQKDVSDFMYYVLDALDRNAYWVNSIIHKQSDFKCVFMSGCGPNRFQLQEIIYPAKQDVSLEFELKDSEDYDKIAVAALLKMSNFNIDYLLKYIKTRLFDNPILRDDLLKGKSMGFSFAVLRPFSEKQYRVVERIPIGSTMKCPIMPSFGKRLREDKLIIGPPIKKTKRVF